MAAANPADRPMLYEALEYLRAEIPVFPVCSPLMRGHKHRDPDTQEIVVCGTGTLKKSLGKTPLIRWRGYQKELPSEDDVRGWWTRWPDANIGFATGELSGILVLDTDGTEAQTRCLQLGGLDETPTLWTGKVGGAHFHLAYPGGDVRNFAGKMPGTDLRGQGGYALLPPSLHASGNRYRWVEHTRGIPTSPTPEWLTALIEADNPLSDGGSSYGDHLDLDDVLQGVKEGKRDDTLFRYACRLRHDDVLQEHAEALIRLAARACDPPFPEAAAIGKVRRAYKDYPPGSASPDVDFDVEFGTDHQTAAPASLDADPETQEDGWKVYDAADFLKIDYPVVQWRVQGFLRDRAILFNFGAPGSIKTYIATDAAVAVAIGGLFLGEYPCDQGRVLIVQEDTLDSDFQQAYLGPLVRARGIDPEDLRGHLFIAPPGGMTLGVPEKVQELCRWIEEYMPDLLVLDAFYLMHDGEGYGKDLGPIMKRIKALRAKYGCAIWIIDHDRKGKAEASSSENPIDRLWGGRQKSAAVDAIVESRPIKGSHGETFLDVIKLRGAKPAEPIRVKLYPDYKLLIEGEGEEEEVSPEGTVQVVYEWLCREGGSRTKAQISNGVNLSMRTIEAALYTLKRDGLAKKNGKVGRAETWIALRKSEAAPVIDGPSFDWDEDE